MATARLDMRLDKNIKAKAEKASALLGHKSLTDYVVSIINDNASQVIAMHESMTIESNVFDLFMEACDKATKPNAALASAAQFAKEQGFK